MRKILSFLFAFSLCYIGFSQGSEDFEDLVLTGSSYSDGTFTNSASGITWHYLQSRGDQSIDGQSLMLGRNRTPTSELVSWDNGANSVGTISGGIGTLTFDYQRAYGTDVDMNIYVNGNLIGTVTTNGETTVQHATFVVNVSGAFSLKFINENGNDSGQVTLDNIAWTAPGGTVCAIPTNLVSSNVDYQSATISWDGIGSEWEVVYGDNITDPNTDGTTVSPNPTSNSVSLSGLSPNTTYSVYVRTICTEGNSDWSSPLTFSTGSAPGAGGGLETFDGMTYTGSAYQTGSFTGQDGSTWTYESSSGNQSITGQSIMLGKNKSPDGQVVSGTISGGIGKLEFDYEQAYSSDVSLSVYVNGNEVGVLTSSGQQNQVLHASIQTINIGGDFTMKFINEDGSNSGQVIIDNISWTSYESTGPTCDAPTDLTANMVDDSSADIAWTGSGEEYEVVYGAGITDPDTEGTTISPNPTNPSIAINGLSANTSYSVFVRTVCDGSNSSWTGPLSFTTPIPASGVSLPYCEDFENIIADSPIMPNGWTNQNANGGTNLWEGKSFSGNSYVQASAFNSGEDPMVVWLVTPKIDLSSVTGATLNFETIDGYNNGDALSVYVSTDFSGDATTATWIPITATLSTGNSSGYASDFTASGNIDLSDYAGGHVYVGFKYEGADGGITTTFQVDNVCVTESTPPPACDVPSDLAATNISDTSADISWTGSGGEYEVVYGEGITDPDTEGTTVTPNPSSTSITLDNLDAETTYTVFVRTVCGETNSSWTASLDFTTEPAPNQGPGGMETFDGMTYTGSSYQAGSFTGQDGSTWTYESSAGSKSITGQSIMLGRNKTPDGQVVSGTISGGIGSLEFDYEQAYSTDVSLSVYVNGSEVGVLTSSDQSGQVLHASIPNINVSGDFSMKFINEDGSNSGQVVIDNISWTGFSAPVIPGPVPCAPYNNVNDAFYITNVSTTGANQNIDNTTGFSAGGYGDYVGSQIIKVKIGQTLNFNVAFTVDNDPNAIYNVSIWVDIDHNGSFWNTGEKILSTNHVPLNGGEVYTSSITVPSSFAPGVYRLRVRASAYNGTTLKPCGLNKYSETEDYVVVVLPASAPRPGTAQNNNGSVFKDFAFYPNPAQGHLYLQSPNQIQQLRLYNMLGQKVIDRTPNAWQLKLNTSGLQTGVYIMKVTLKGQTKTFRVLKK